MRCSAPWYELNISAPDNNVSGCCYYGGEKNVWDDTPRDLGWYWNGEGLKQLRRLQAGVAPPVPNGCSDCFFFGQTLPGDSYFDFSPTEPPAALSPAQAANWRKAKAEHAAGIEHVECLPLRLYVNFGYACNLSCRMCHQVPRRGELRRQVLADNVLRWGDQIASAMEVVVIGGEPFTLPEAIKFTRAFVADPRYEAVQLMVCTNGTVMHKHWATLRQKQKLSLRVSIDSIGEGFEKIRLGGQWADVERNLLTAMETKSASHPQWQVGTTANIQKAGIPYLGAFARWHVKHGIRSFFFDFISAPGVEDVYLTDNVLHNPHLVEDMPDWADHFDDAASTFRRAGWSLEADQLEQFRDRVRNSIAEKADHVARMRRQRGRNDWVAQKPDEEGRVWADTLIEVAPEGRSAVPLGEHLGQRAFTLTRLGDYLATPYLRIRTGPQGGQFRVRIHWPKRVHNDPLIRLAHLAVEGNDRHQMGGFTEILDFGFGTDTVITGHIPDWVTEIRVILTPLGEEVTLLPAVIEVDLDPETERLSAADRSGKGAGGWVASIGQVLKRFRGSLRP